VLYSSLYLIQWGTTYNTVSAVVTMHDTPYIADCGWVSLSQFNLRHGRFWNLITALYMLLPLLRFSLKQPLLRYLEFALWYYTDCIFVACYSKPDCRLTAFIGRTNNRPAVKINLHWATGFDILSLQCCSEADLDCRTNSMSNDST
jgi:hypothetical protein